MTIIALPWIFDRHSHVCLYAALQGCPSLAGLDRASALDLLRQLPEETLSLVVGWHSGQTPLTESDFADLPPALVVNYSLHGLRITPAARARMRDLDPELAMGCADPDWSERNLPRLLALYARTAKLDAAKLGAFMGAMERLGIGALEDMLLPGEEAWRVVQASPWASRLRFWVGPDVYGSLPVEAQHQAEGLKFFLDGSLGARTAALSRPYRGGGTGLLTYTDGALQEALAEVHPLGKALAVHAIGDRAIAQLLGVLERLDREGLGFSAVRIEHAQFITEAQARRARDLGLVLSMQPNFNSDSVDYADRLDAEHLATNNPFRMLIDRCGFRPGVDLILGSDGMPHGPAYALQWTRFPAFPGQALHLEELLSGYGTHPAAPGIHRVEVDEAARTVRALD